MKFIKSGKGNWIQSRAYSKRILLDKINLLSNNALVQIIRIKPHDVVADHFHKRTTEIFYGLSGSGTFIINGNEIIFAKGDLLICEQGEIHATRNPHNENWEYLAVKSDNKDDTYWL